MVDKTSAATLPDLHTYHCICTNLVIASTKPLLTLSRRTAGQDNAHILPLPASALSAAVDGDSNAGGEAAWDARTLRGDYATLLSTTRDTKPVIIRREDGFDKRYIQRCGRCNIPVGYQLDWAQTPSPGREAQAQPTSGPNTSVIYLLPGGFLSTSEMVAGKNMAALIELPAC